jgi:succinyl-CoA:acetate CoA-transferase
MFADRIRLYPLMDRIVSADQAAQLIKDGMIVGMSGFTRAGDAKAVPLAMARRARTDPFQITLVTGASLGKDVDRVLTEAHILKRRMPFQADRTLRTAINNGEVMFVDQHLSETVEHLRSGQLGPMNYAIIEAAAITEDGGIVPTTSVGNSTSFAALAENLIIEINLSQPLELEGLHDIYTPTRRPAREPIPVIACDSRIGLTEMRVDPAKIAAIVITEQSDSAATLDAPSAETDAIANHLIAFLVRECGEGRLNLSVNPLQAGIGNISNAVLAGLASGPFDHLQMYSEVLQDSTFALLDSGKLAFASGSSITLSEAYAAKVFANLGHYKDRLVLRPQEISNHPEVIRRLGIVAINTALEFDIYGNVNSTHVNGTEMVNGIGGSGDFARNAYLSIFVAKSLAKDGAISSVVPMVSHVDHTEHDVDILVTENGLADLRELAPRERATAIIANCVHPSYRGQLADYYSRALVQGGHTPHLLDEALSWHQRRKQTGTMRADESPVS